MSGYEFIPEEIERWRTTWKGLHKSPPPFLFHYTDAVGLRGIVDTSELWASHVRYVNDAQEFVYAREISFPAAFLPISTRLRPVLEQPGLRYPSPVQQFPRITIDPEVMGGKPCIRGMRVTVGMVVEALSAGRTIEQLLADFPYLEEPDIREALAFAASLAQWHEVRIAS